MGFNLIQNMKHNGYEPIGFDVNTESMKKLNDLGIQTAKALPELIKALPQPRFIMLSLPSGKITEDTFQELLTMLAPGDTIIDAGNSFYKDSLRRNEQAVAKGMHFVDAGTSGGTSGALNGACFMVGGDDEVMNDLSPMFESMAVKDGFLHTGRPGSGHFSKMVHNGVEYGMMQAIGEGFEIIENSEFDYDKAALAKVWNHGSVIRSWLIELAQQAFEKDANLDQISGVVDMNGEGLWTVIEALEQGTPAPVITLSVDARQRSQQKDTFSGKVVASLRNEFGGHALHKEKK